MSLPDDLIALAVPPMLAALHFIVVRRFIYSRIWRERPDVRRLEVVVFLLFGLLVCVGVVFG